MLNSSIHSRVSFLKHQTGALKQNIIVGLLLISGLIAIVAAMLPPSYSTDLSVIGQGKPVIALIHDNDSSISIELMEAFNVIRADYEQLIEFIAIDRNAPAGQQFLIKNNVSSANALYFTAQGERIFTLHGPMDALELTASIQKAFGF